MAGDYLHMDVRHTGLKLVVAVLQRQQVWRKSGSKFIDAVGSVFVPAGSIHAWRHKVVCSIDNCAHQIMMLRAMCAAEVGWKGGCWGWPYKQNSPSLRLNVLPCCSKKRSNACSWRLLIPTCYSRWPHQRCLPGSAASWYWHARVGCEDSKQAEAACLASSHVHQHSSDRQSDH